MYDYLTPADFPLIANGQYVYSQRASGPILGPVAYTLAEDIAKRLNRDQRLTHASDLRKLSAGEEILTWPMTLDALSPSPLTQET